MINDVYYFTRHITQIPFHTKPTLLIGERKEFALKALEEELFEFSVAENINDQIDALLDLVYFALGRLYEMGIPVHAAKACWNAVHQANMEKTCGITSRGFFNDAVKPEGWVAPDHSWVEALGPVELELLQ